MTATIAYVRVSTDDQTTEAQRHAISQLLAPTEK